MSSRHLLPTLRALVAAPGAPTMLAASSLCRLSYAMMSLSMLLSVQRGTGSLMCATLASASFTVFAMSAPWKARWIDQRGHRRAIVVLGASFSAAIVGLAITAASGLQSSATYMVICAIAGLLSPPIGPSVRSIWAFLSTGITGLQQIYSLDLVLEDVMFTLGPLLVAPLVAFNGPILALCVSASLMSGGSVLFLRSPDPIARTERVSFFHSDAAPSLRWTPDFLALLAVIIVLASALGMVEVAVIERVLVMNVPALSGYLLAVLTLGGVIGGPLWAQHFRGYAPRSQLGVLALLLAASTAAFLISSETYIMGLSLFLFGGAISPVLSVSFVAAEAIFTAQARAEANAWVGTAFNGATALGAVIEGMAVAHHLVSYTIIFDVVLATTAGLLLLVIRRVRNVPIATNRETD
jgi:hypothetical protein